MRIGRNSGWALTKTRFCEIASENPTPLVSSSSRERVLMGPKAAGNSIGFKA